MDYSAEIKLHKNYIRNAQPEKKLFHTKTSWKKNYHCKTQLGKKTTLLKCKLEKNYFCNSSGSAQNLAKPARDAV